jgi:cellulose synthase/poly-beta-1,6-N-acetylglucosamine synthase-like glycosyltransferase
VVTLLEILIGAAACVLLLPIAVLMAEVLLAVTLRRRAASPEPSEGRRPKLAVLIPAHDEASLIASTLRTVVPQLNAGDRLILVADNCTDDTAKIGAAEGAEVLVRTDMLHRGKGYALDFGVRHLEANAPEIVLVVDADCQIAPGSIDRLARVCSRSARPVQALYLMHAGENASPKTRIAEFAWVIKNQIRPTGLHRLGLPCQLMGTGMAFPWACISTAELATGHIVEDLKLGIDLARAGTPPLFCPEALVTSDFPASAEGIRSQRTRWEHGHLGVILGEAPRLLAHALVAGDAGSLVLALDLSVPPLALLMLLSMSVWLAAVLLLVLTKSAFAFAVATAICGLLASAVLVCWLSYGRHIISLPSLAFAAIRAILKIPLYFRFVVARQSKWVRSKRDAGPN